MRPWIVAALILLLAIELSDLPVLPGTPRAAFQPVQHSVVRGKKLPTADFSMRWNGELDREAFLRSFARQSEPTLKKCLQEHPQIEHSFTVSGLLGKKGRLKNVMVWSANQAPECVASSIEAMNFSSLSQQLRSTSVEARWRVDW
jgi:hypothetical protein